MPRHTTAVLCLVPAVLAAGVVAYASPARAGLVTHCVGTGGAVTVPNDLLVPAGESCALTGTTVTGNVQVAAGASLVISGGTVNGDVQVAADGYLDVLDTRLDGSTVLAAGGFGVYLKNATSGTVTLQPRGSAPIEGFLFVDATTVDGNVAAGVGDVRLDKGTQVTGNVSSNGAYYTDVHDSFVDGTLSVLNNGTGSVVCGSAVQGRATFAGNLGGVQLGPNGTLDGCASGSYWARDVSVTNTTGGVVVDDNIINGRLQLSGNTPVARVAPGNRIRGGITGEHTTTAAAAKARAAAPTAARQSGDDRAADRREHAVDAATTAGPADL